MCRNILVFVYGTLLSGEANHRLLAEADFIAEAELKGVEMYDNGSYPMIIDGENSCEGEVYSINQQELRRLDILEGYTEGKKDCLYSREKVRVYPIPDGEAIEAYVYKYKKDTSMHKKVQNGVRWTGWRR